MLEYSKEFILKASSIDEAIYVLFEHKETLDDTYGINQYTFTPWEKNKKTIKHFFVKDDDKIPPMFEHLIGGDQIRAKMKMEKIVNNDNSVIIKCKIIPKIVGASFIKIKPKYTFKNTTQGIFVHIHCCLKAYLPEGMKEQCEKVMQEKSNDIVSFIYNSLIKQNKINLP